MTQTTIYLSVIRDKDILILDGNLYLFKELLITLNNAVENIPQADPDLPTRSEAQEINQDGKNVGS